MPNFYHLPISTAGIQGGIMKAYHTDQTYLGRLYIPVYLTPLFRFHLTPLFRTFAPPKC